MAADTIKVWKIFRFEKRFELPDDMRKCKQGPLVFVKDYVGSGQDDESIRFGQQIRAMMMMPDALLLRGAFAVLREIAANRSRRYRGYLLDENLLPAAPRKIGFWLGTDLRKTKKILDLLQSVGVIELVNMPEFPEIKDEEEDDQDENSGARRNSPPNGGKPLKNKGEGKGKRVTGTGNSKNKYPGKPGKEKPKENPNPKWKANTDLQWQAEEMAGKSQKQPEPEGETATSPPTIQNAENPKYPKYPTKTDGGVPKEHHDAHAGRTQLESTSLARDCTGFAEEVYRRMGLQPTEKNPQAAELASWSNAWARAVALHRGTPWLLELRNKTLKKADKLRNRRGPGNKSAILMHEFNKRILAGKAG